MVENQNILRINSGLCLNKDDESSIAIRIMEVSKNHQNQVRLSSLVVAMALLLHGV